MVFFIKVLVRFLPVMLCLIPSSTVARLGTYTSLIRTAHIFMSVIISIKIDKS